jgi:hypothetical protein
VIIPAGYSVVEGKCRDQDGNRQCSAPEKVSDLKNRKLLSSSNSTATETGIVRTATPLRARAHSNLLPRITAVISHSTARTSFHGVNHRLTGGNLVAKSQEPRAESYYQSPQLRLRKYNLTCSLTSNLMYYGLENQWEVENRLSVRSLSGKAFSRSPVNQPTLSFLNDKNGGIKSHMDKINHIICIGEILPDSLSCGGSTFHIWRGIATKTAAR